MKLIKILILIAVPLVILRLAMPYALLYYAENRINRIPGYAVHIADVDVHLWRGSYTIKGINLYNINKHIPVPFFSADAVDLSVQWGALLKGAFVAKLIAQKPVINFVIDPKGQNEQLSINKEWERAVRALFPLNLNQISTRNGQLYLHSFAGNPPFKLYLKNINLEINNMQKVAPHAKAKWLTSSFHGTANSMDGANAFINGTFDPFAKQPTFYFNGALKSMSIEEANNFLRHYTAADVKHGDFSLFVEIAAAKGKITGYAKPIIKNLQILDMKEKMNPIEALYKGALEVVSKIITNPDKKTIATKIKIEGNIDDPNTSVLSIIGHILSHAFIQALLPQIDHTVQVKDVLIGKRA